MVRSLLVFLLKDATKLVQFLHEVVLHVQASSCVEQKQIPTSRLGGGVSVKGHGSCVGTVMPCDDLKIKACRPSLELLCGSGAKGITCAYEYGMTCVLPKMT